VALLQKWPGGRLIDLSATAQIVVGALAASKSGDDRVYARGAYFLSGLKPSRGLTVTAALQALQLN
jgi:hypothetical protein